MSQQHWAHKGLGLTLLVVMTAQTLLAVGFAVFVLFRAMGGNYFAAVMAAGAGGLTLGATPTAIANMTAVTKRYGPSPLAFVVLPLVSAFFIDILVPHAAVRRAPSEPAVPSSTAFSAA